MKFIGNRISFKEKAGIFSIVIAASVEKYKETLLAAWLLCWTLSGGYFIYQMFTPLPKETKLAVVVLLSFWAYYEYRVFTIFLWRKYGYESIRFIEDKIVIRDVIKSRGKSQEYYIENIKQLVKLQIDSHWMKVMDQSFWVKGNGYIQFEYQGKLITFGRQLNDTELNQLFSVIHQQLSQRKKRS